MNSTVGIIQHGFLKENPELGITNLHVLEGYGHFGETRMCCAV
jgi:hypothetical protein